MEQDFYGQQQDKISQQTPVESQPVMTPPVKKPKTFLIILGAFLLVGVGAAGGYILSKNSSYKSEPNVVIAATPTLAPSPISLKTYTSTYGFSFRYPDALTPIEDSAHNSVSFIDSGKGENTDGSNVVMNVSFRDVAFTTSPTGNVTEGGTDFVTGWKTVTVGEKLAHSYSTHECAPRCPVITVDIPAENGAKTVTYQYMRKNTEVLEKALSSFQFIKITTEKTPLSMKIFTHANPSYSINYPANYYVNDESYGVEFTAEKPILDAPSNLNGFGISYRDSAISAAFNALTEAKVGADVKEAQSGVDVKVTKLKNLKLDGYETVEYIHDGTVPPTSGLGRGPIGYSHIYLIKINETSYLSISNTSMKSLDVTNRDTVFQQMITSLKITK